MVWIWLYRCVPAFLQCSPLPPAMAHVFPQLSTQFSMLIAAASRKGLHTPTATGHALLLQSQPSSIKQAHTHRDLNLRHSQRQLAGGAQKTIC